MKLPRTLLAMLLCLALLLSSCITANTAYYKPEPASGEDLFNRMVGGFLDIGLTSGALYLAAIPAKCAGRTERPECGFLALATLAVPFLVLGADLVISDSLPYRKAYYEKKEAEDETMEPEEEPSKQGEPSE